MEDIFSAVEKPNNVSLVPEKPDGSLRDIFQEPDCCASLSGSELDLLCSIKELVIARAKNKGCEDASLKFSLDMYRGIGVILLEDLKVRMKKNSLVLDVSEGSNRQDELHMMNSDNIRQPLCPKDCSMHFVMPK